MAKDLFDHNYQRTWPDQFKFPLNEETTGYKAKEWMFTQSSKQRWN